MATYFFFIFIIIFLFLILNNQGLWSRYRPGTRSCDRPRFHILGRHFCFLSTRVAWAIMTFVWVIHFNPLVIPIKFVCFWFRIYFKYIFCWNFTQTIQCQFHVCKWYCNYVWRFTTFKFLFLVHSKLYQNIALTNQEYIQCCFEHYRVQCMRHEISTKNPII